LVHIAEIKQIDDDDAIETGSLGCALADTYKHGHAHQQQSDYGLVEGETFGDHHEGEAGFDGVIEDVGERGNQAASTAISAYLCQPCNGLGISVKDRGFACKV
jgi:hypothetical protein